MPSISRQREPIAVYGATGYTGKLVAAELAASGTPYVLAARSREKLDALASELGGDVVSRAVALDDRDGLREMLADCAAVIACAGPFSVTGEPVLAAAVETKTHYLDTTGEQPFMRLALEGYGPRAEAAGVAVIPAMAFDYIPGDMIAALTAEGMGEVDEVTIAYDVKGFGMTRGTQLSGIEMLLGGDVEWRKLQWLPADQSVSRGHFDFGEPLGRQRMMRYPAGEHITVPRHIRTRQVRTMITYLEPRSGGSRPPAPPVHPPRRPGDEDPAAKARRARSLAPAGGPQGGGPKGRPRDDRLRGRKGPAGAPGGDPGVRRLRVHGSGDRASRDHRCPRRHPRRGRAGPLPGV